MIILTLQVLTIILVVMFKIYKKLENKKCIFLLTLSEIATIGYSCLYYLGNKDFNLIFVGMIAVIGIYIAYIDIESRTISMKLLVPCCIIALSFAILRSDIAFYNPIITGVIAYGVLILMYKVSKQQIGDGDIKLIVLYSVVYGFSDIVSVLFYSFITCLLFGLGAILIKKKNMKMELPFAPFMVAGAILFDIFRTIG